MEIRELLGKYGITEEHVAKEDFGCYNISTSLVDFGELNDAQVAFIVEYFEKFKNNTIYRLTEEDGIFFIDVPTDNIPRNGKVHVPKCIDSYYRMFWDVHWFPGVCIDFGSADLRGKDCTEMCWGIELGCSIDMSKCIFDETSNVTDMFLYVDVPYIRLNSTIKKAIGFESLFERMVTKEILWDDEPVNETLLKRSMLEVTDRLARDYRDSLLDEDIEVYKSIGLSEESSLEDIYSAYLVLKCCGMDCGEDVTFGVLGSKLCITIHNDYILTENDIREVEELDGYTPSSDFKITVRRKYTEKDHMFEIKQCPEFKNMTVVFECAGVSNASCKRMFANTVIKCIDLTKCIFDENNVHLYEDMFSNCKVETLIVEESTYEMLKRTGILNGLSAGEISFGKSKCCGKCLSAMDKLLQASRM